MLLIIKKMQQEHGKNSIFIRVCVYRAPTVWLSLTICVSTSLSGGPRRPLVLQVSSVPAQTPVLNYSCYLVSGTLFVQSVQLKHPDKHPSTCCHSHKSIVFIIYKKRICLPFFQIIGNLLLPWQLKRKAEHFWLECNAAFYLKSFGEFSVSYT